jgi:GTPase KRas
MSNLNYLKIALFGDCDVGKSSITTVFINGILLDYFYPTIEESYSKHIKIDKESYILEVIDVKCPEEFRSFREIYMHSHDAFVLVYSITSKNSFSEIQSFYDQICEVVK